MPSFKRKRRLYYKIEDWRDSNRLWYSYLHHCWHANIEEYDKACSVTRLTLRQAFKEAKRLIAAGGKPRITRFRYGRGGWREWNSYTYKG